MNFSKYHGCGNDFIITTFQEGIDYKSLAIEYCKPHIGIGADGFIVLKTNPLEMCFYNSDGSMAPMCGNGIRCLALYALDNGLASGKSFDIKTPAGVMRLSVDGEMITVNMGSPIWGFEAIKATDKDSFINRELEVDGIKVKITSLFMGTIHTVVFVNDWDLIDKHNLGELICNHALFKEKTNVNFVQVSDKENFLIRTYERGVGWTFACGTGACSAFVVGKKLGYCDEKVYVHLKYGTLEIFEKKDIYMIGPAKKVFDGRLEEKI